MTDPRPPLSVPSPTEARIAEAIAYEIKRGFADHPGYDKADVVEAMKPLTDALSALQQRVEEVTKERDHERHEKETVADAAKAHAQWSIRQRESAESTIASLKGALEKVDAQFVRVDEDDYRRRWCTGCDAGFVRGNAALTHKHDCVWTVLDAALAALPASEGKS